MFSLSGSTCLLVVNQTADGTSNATTFTITLPISALTGSPTYWGACGLSKDNSANLTTPAGWRIEPSSSTTIVTLFKDMAVGAWTNSGAKRVRFVASYQI